MNVTYPLSLKVSLWLLLNLLLLSLAGVGLYWMQFGRGWESVTVGTMGERLQAVAEKAMTEFNLAGPDERDATLAALGGTYGARFYVFLQDAQQLAGDPVSVPPEVREELLRGPRRGGPPRGPGGGRRGGEGEIGPAARGGFPGAGRGGPTMGRFIVRTGDPTETWLGLRVAVFVERGAPTLGTLVIRASNAFVLARLLGVGPLLALGGGAFALSVLFWLPLVRSVTRDVRRLKEATEAIAEGRFDTRVPDQRRDELGHLGQSVNRMAGRLDTLVNGQRRFLGDIAHELGSPLGRLQVATEILESRAGPTLRENVNDVREEVQQMAALVDELLAFTKAGMRPRAAALATVEVPAVIATVLAREGGVGRVEVALPASLPVRADGPLLERAMGNLVRNALRYAGEGASISIRAQSDARTTTVIVEDNGPGVPAEALARLGEPFYRPETARARETGGVGLGLAIVRSSIAACGGEVRFTNGSPQGFRAEVSLARADTAAA